MILFKTIAKRLVGTIANLFFGNAPAQTSLVEQDETSSIQLGENVTIKDSKIVLKNKSKLFIEDGVIIDQFDLFLDKGSLHIGKNSILKKASYIKPEIVINDGKVEISNNCIIKADILCNYSGELQIGQYTAINQDTNIRCSESISIGAFNMIAYECLIFDNNTHEFLSPEKRRERTIRDFPFVGAEYSKPSSNKIIIGNDVWIGQRASILKGSIIEDESIIGTGAVVSGKKIPFQSIAVGNPSRIIGRKEQN